MFMETWSDPTYASTTLCLAACSLYCFHKLMNVSPPLPLSCVYSRVPYLPAGTGFPVESRTHSTCCTTLFPEPAHCCLSLLHVSLTSPLNLVVSVIPQVLFSHFWWVLPRFQTVSPPHTCCSFRLPDCFLRVCLSHQRTSNLTVY